MDSFKNFASGAGQQDSAQQAQVWNLTSRAPSPIIIYSGTVNTGWTLLYTIAESTFVELKEGLLYNGDASDQHFSLALVPPGGTVPSGSSLNQPHVVRSDFILSGLSKRWKFSTGMPFGWNIYGWTSAGAGIKTNMCLSAVLVTYLS